MPAILTLNAQTCTSAQLVNKRYVNSGALIDPVAIDIDAASKPFLDLHRDTNPPAFTDWQAFGAPDGAPGRSMKISLSLGQHELVAWTLTIHVLAAAELAAAHLAGPAAVDARDRDPSSTKHRLPPPRSPDPPPDRPPSAASSVMYGVPLTDGGLASYGTGDGTLSWYMNPIYCQTSFNPTVGGRLQESIVAGVVPETVDLMFPKGPSMYNISWVRDLGPEAMKNNYG